VTKKSVNFSQFQQNFSFVTSMTCKMLVVLLFVAFAGASPWNSQTRKWTILSGGADEIQSPAPTPTLFADRPTVRVLRTADNRTEVYLCGSAHALKSSENLSREMVRTLKPDLILLELCDKRYQILSPVRTLQKIFPCQFVISLEFNFKPVENDTIANASLFEVLQFRRSDPALSEMPMAQFLAVYYQLRVRKSYT